MEKGYIGMDNHIFRSAIGGFNRQDVMEYIERTQKQSEESVAWLESQVEQLQRAESEAQAALQECMEERDRLKAELDKMNDRFNKAKGDWEMQARARKASDMDVVQRDQTIREIMEENQKLIHRLQELEGDRSGLERQKLQLTQLELDALMRSENVEAQAEAKAKKITAEAEAEAQKVTDAAKEHAKNIVSEAEETSKSVVHKAKLYMEDTAEDFAEILQTFQEVSVRICGQLKQLDKTVAEFPVGLVGLKKDLDELCGRINEKDVEAQDLHSETADQLP